MSRQKENKLAICAQRSAIVACALAAFAVSAGCSEEQVITTTRNLARPGPIGLACVGRQRSDSATGGFATNVCTQDANTATSGADGGVADGGSVDGGSGAPVEFRLYGFVANTARGDVALFDATKNGDALIDLDPGSPGFDYVPVGNLPTDLKTSADGCRAVTANHGSCDLSLIDLPQVVDLAARRSVGPTAAAVGRLIPRTAAGPLAARPQEVVFVPSSVPAGSGQCSTTTAYHAYVTFPACQLVAEIDLRSGLVVRAVQFVDGKPVLTNQPSCRAECQPRAATGGSDAGTSDGSSPDGALAADAGVVADAGTSDAASNDAGASTATVSATGVLPYALAIDGDAGRLYVSSLGAGFISAIDIDAGGAFSAVRRIDLEGDARTTRLRLSPQTQAMGRFVYAIARDRTVRVISTLSERECETNADAAKLADPVALDKARCFAASGADAPVRQLGRTSPGLVFPGRVPADVAFVSPPSGTRLDAGVEAGPQASPMSGIFALVATTDGTVFVVDVEDTNQIQAGTQSLSPSALPHRVRNAAQGTELADTDASVGLISGAGSGGVPVVVNRVGEQTLGGGGIELKSLGQSATTQLSLVYEPRLLDRTGGLLRVSEDRTQLELFDPGADFCSAGVFGHELDANQRPLRFGDVLLLVGCENDEQCGTGRVCRKPVAQSSSFGLCLDADREDALFRQCADFLRQPREFLVREAWRDRLVLDALPIEPQRVIVQPNPTSSCKSNSDCSDGFFCALADRQISASAERSVKAGSCFRPGCLEQADCQDGDCVAALRDGRRQCAPVRLPLEVGGSCNVDADCRPAATGGSCEVDRDCDARAECRRLVSSGGRQCVTRNLVCAKAPGLSGRCVRPSPCFAELVRYQVFAGRSFVLNAADRRIPDEQSGRCKDDPAQDPLTNNRVPLGLPVYPVISGPQCTATPTPSVCVDRIAQGYGGFVRKDGDSGDELDPPQTGPSTLIRFANTEVSFALGISHLARPLVTAAGADAGAGALQTPPMPERGLTIRLDLNNGYRELVVGDASRLISLADRLYRGPDGKVYVVDIGDTRGTSATRGQVLRFDQATLSFESFLVR